jgi:hypothetical protein
VAVVLLLVVVAPVVVALVVMSLLVDVSVPSPSPVPPFGVVVDVMTGLVVVPVVLQVTHWPPVVVEGVEYVVVV